jgi:hypothetical protein
VQWAALQAKRYPALALLLAVPNGGMRTKRTAGRLKAEGVKPGVPDLFLPASSRDMSYAGLWIEMKRRRGGTVTAAQRWWHEELREECYRVEICRGADEAIAVLTEYVTGAAQ